MARTRGSTKQRGLAGGHQSKRQTALRDLQDMDLCARCELRGRVHYMWRSLVTRRPDGRLVAPLLDLDDFPGRVFGGPQVKRLSYRRCNRSAGASLGNRLRALTRPATPAKYTRW